MYSVHVCVRGKADRHLGMCEGQHSDLFSLSSFALALPLIEMPMNFFHLPSLPTLFGIRHLHMHLPRHPPQKKTHFILSHSTQSSGLTYV